MKKETGLREQDAPEKNTDRAFVKVKKDGSPDLPAQREKTPDRTGKDQPERPKKR